MAEGTALDPTQLSREIDALVEFLQRLDHAGRWPEALRLARALSGLLALTQRWAELVRSLRVALGAAKDAGDLHALGWAQHELGTLHLAAEDLHGAKRELALAHDIRRRLGDRSGLEATDRNLQVLDRHLRELIGVGKVAERSGALLRDVSPVKAMLTIAAAALLFTGGVAGGIAGGGPSDGSAIGEAVSGRDGGGVGHPRPGARTTHAGGRHANNEPGVAHTVKANGAPRARSTRERPGALVVDGQPGAGRAGDDRYPVVSTPAPRPPRQTEPPTVRPSAVHPSSVEPPVVKPDVGNAVGDCGQETSGSRERGLLSAPLHQVDHALGSDAQRTVGRVVHDVNCAVTVPLGL